MSANYGKNVLENLFIFYTNNPKLLPVNWQNEPGGSVKDNNRLVCDFIACMTDTFAIKQFNKMLNK